MSREIKNRAMWKPATSALICYKMSIIQQTIGNLIQDLLALNPPSAKDLAEMTDCTYYKVRE